MSNVALHSGSKTYFFSGDQYIRVTRGDTGPGELDEGYPKKISEGWNFPEVDLGAEPESAEYFGEHGIDTALYSGSKFYFFNGSKYIRMTRHDTTHPSPDDGYPESIRNWNWSKYFYLKAGRWGIDAALHSGSKTYFFVGDQYIRVTRGDTGAGTVDDPSHREISVWNFPLLPDSDEEYFGEYGIDAALYSGSKTYFFSGDQYICVTRGDTGAGTVDDGYPQHIRAWEWHTEFEESWTEIGRNFKFERGYPIARRNLILAQHRLAFPQIEACIFLTDSQKEAMKRVYRRPIRHYSRDGSGLGSAEDPVDIYVNHAEFSVLPDKYRTSIYWMAVCAGYDTAIAEDISVRVARSSAFIGNDSDRYLGNKRSLELHDRKNLNPNCQVDEVPYDRRHYFSSITDAREQGYDFCAYCFSRELSER